MFDDAQLKEYAAIKAPARIKKRVEHTMMRSRPWPRILSTVAACIALITMISLFSFQRLSAKPLSLSYLGEPITTQGVVVSGAAEKAVAFGAKTIVPSGIPLFVRAPRDAKLSVSGGTIQIFGEEGEILSVGTDLTLHSSTEIRWDVSGLTGGSHTLSINDQIYEIRIDAEYGEMKIHKK